MERGQDDFYSPQDIYQPLGEEDENQEECSDEGEQQADLDTDRLRNL